MECVHVYYEKEADRKVRGDEGTANVSSFVRGWLEKGNAASLLNNNADMDDFLGDIEVEEDEGNAEKVQQLWYHIGRASTGTILAQWDIVEDSVASK